MENLLFCFAFKFTILVMEVPWPLDGVGLWESVELLSVFKLNKKC